MYLLPIPTITINPSQGQSTPTQGWYVNNILTWQHTTTNHITTLSHLDFVLVSSYTSHYKWYIYHKNYTFKTFNQQMPTGETRHDTPTHMTTQQQATEEDKQGGGEPKGQKRITKWIRAVREWRGDPMVRVRARTAVRGAIAVFIPTLLVYSDGALNSMPSPLPPLPLLILVQTCHW